MGIDPVTEVNKAFKRPDIGLSSIFSGGLMYALVGLLCFGIVNLYEGTTQKMLDLTIYHFICIIIISLVVNYLLLFKHDKYLGYFKEFEKMEKADKKMWAWISVGVILGILAFFIGSFIFMNYRL
jgi:multisubunit Na+/H+ antiporter MnhB subunit